LRKAVVGRPRVKAVLTRHGRCGCEDQTHR
jgi:hypothetical protein